MKVGKFPMLANSRAKTNRETDGFVKVDRRRQDRPRARRLDDRLGRRHDDRPGRAGDGVRRDRQRTSPTPATPIRPIREAIKEAAMAVTGKPIHI